MLAGLSSAFEGPGEKSMLFPASFLDRCFDFVV